MTSPRFLRAGALIALLAFLPAQASAFSTPAPRADAPIETVQFAGRPAMRPGGPAMRPGGPGMRPGGPGVRSGAPVRHPHYRGGAPHMRGPVHVNRNVNVNRNIHVNRGLYRGPNVYYRGGVWRRPGSYWWPAGGAIAAGAALGFIAAASAASWAGRPPAPGYCWFYTDSSRRNGFWDRCP